MKDRHVADITGISLKILLILGWHFVLLPLAFLWGLGLLGTFFGVEHTGLTWSAFMGAMFFLAILRSAVAQSPA